MTSTPTVNYAAHQARPLAGQTATIASLSRRERNPQGGEKRRKMVAAVLGTAGGVGSVLAVKSAATAAALWAGSPALVVAGAGLAAVMATSGTLGYFRQRSALKAAGQAVPAFSTKDLFKSMFTSKAALVAGGMTAMAAALPGALMLVVGSSVAALGAGVHEYTSRRAEMRARGVDVGRPSVRDALRTIFKSKSAGTAFLLSAGIGSVLSVLSGTSLSAPAADAPSQMAQGTVSHFNEASGTDNAASLAPVPAPAPVATPEPPMPMPEMVERPAVEPTPAEPAPEKVAPEKTATEKPATEKAAPAVQKPVATPVAAPVQAAAPVIADPAPSEVVFEHTGPDGVRQILYGSGITETIYPADYTGEISDKLAAFADKSAAPASAPAEPVAAPVSAPAATSAAPESTAPASVAAQPAAPVSDTTDANGVRTILHASGIRETITPIYADAAEASAPAAPKLPAAGECLISETDTEIKIDCKIDTSATIQPGSGVDFRAAADPQTVFHAGVSADSDAINAGEFLEDHAVPAAQSAYEKGFFKPQM